MQPAGRTIPCQHASLDDWMRVTRIICSCDMLATFSSTITSLFMRCVCNATFTSRIKGPNKIIYRRKRRLLESVRELVGFLFPVQLSLHLCKQKKPQCQFRGRAQAITVPCQFHGSAHRKCRSTCTAQLHERRQSTSHAKLASTCTRNSWLTFCSAIGGAPFA